MLLYPLLQLQLLGQQNTLVPLPQPHSLLEVPEEVQALQFRLLVQGFEGTLPQYITQRLPGGQASPGPKDSLSTGPCVFKQRSYYLSTIPQSQL